MITKKDYGWEKIVTSVTCFVKTAANPCGYWVF
jgi:hypothetical protein